MSIRLSKVSVTPKKGLQELQGIPVIHFILGLRNSSRKLNGIKKGGGEHKLLIFSLYEHLGNKSLGKIIN